MRPPCVLFHVFYLSLSLSRVRPRLLLSSPPPLPRPPPSLSLSLSLSLSYKADAPGTVVPVDAIPDGTMGLDIGPDTMDTFHNELAGNSTQDSNGSRTVVWNGPMGVS